MPPQNFEKYSKTKDTYFPLQKYLYLLHETNFFLTEYITYMAVILTRPTLERRKTLGHLRSINRNMIIHFANQSQTCQLLKIKKKNYFFKHFMKRTCEKWCNQSQVELLEKSISIIVLYIYVEFLA